jgi:hypothetical protein|tara:strand:+ start:4569 stop:4808 length:240 start_codon:yes stop_codon:yes gene_type:complete
MSREDEAKNLLENKLFREAVDTLGIELLDRWTGSGVDDVNQRESIWLALRLLHSIEGHIKSIVETGHMAKIMEKQNPYI